MNHELAIIMPVYNEEVAIEGVIEEWHEAVEKIPGAKLFVFNDGSRDGTLAKLRVLEKKHPLLTVIDKPNEGHGQTCLRAYRLAGEQGFHFIFQTDSDGQTRADEFVRVWNSKTPEDRFIFGYRASRGDGFARFLISRVLRLTIFFTAGTWVRDANVPFRLMRVRDIQPLIKEIPQDFFLVNVLLSVMIQNAGHKIRWVPISFKPRVGSEASIRAWGFLKRGWQFIQQLRAVRKRLA